MAAQADLGRAQAFFEDADRLRRSAAELEHLAARVRAIDLGSWTGEAADTFAETHHRVRRSLLTLADGVAEVATAMERHGDVAAWAERTVANALVTTAGEADELLGAVNDAVAASAARLARLMRSLAAATPDPLNDRSVVWHLLRQAGRGAGEATLGIASSIWKGTVIRRLLDPVGVASDDLALAGAAIATVQNPAATIRAMSDVDTWRTNPLRAFGRLVPEALLASTGAGGGAVAASAAGRGMSAARLVRMAKAEAEEAGQAVEGQRTAGTMSMSDWAVPEWLAEAARKVPVEWGVALTNRRGIGFRWFDDSGSSGVRVDEADPESPFAPQRSDHVLVRSGGNVIGCSGEVVVGSIKSSAIAAHIPLDEWMRWTTWNRP